MSNLKDYIDYLIQGKIQKEEGIKLLTNDTNLKPEEKNLIYAYCYPRNLLDRELPGRFSEYLKTRGNGKGYLTPHFGSITLIIEAYRTEQYSRFIRHLMHAFLDDPSKISPVSGEDKEECPICGKTVYENELWVNLLKPNTPEKENQEYLAYGSSDSGIILCKDCLVQLMAAREILETLEPGFLRSKPSNCGWDNLKL